MVLPYFIGHTHYCIYDLAWASSICCTSCNIFQLIKPNVCDPYDVEFMIRKAFHVPKAAATIWQDSYMAALDMVGLGDNAQLRGCCLSRGSRANDAVKTWPVIICPARKDAGRTTPEQTSHYYHYSTELANSWYFHDNLYCIALTEPPPWTSCS